MKLYADVMASATEDVLLAPWQRDFRAGARDVYADYNKLTLAVTLKTLFGAESDGEGGKKVADATKVAFYHFQ